MITKISGSKLEVLRGRLIAQTERNINWLKFAKICNLTPNTIYNLRSGKTGGTMVTCDKIVNGLRRHGLDVGIDDLLA